MGTVGAFFKVLGVKVAVLITYIVVFYIGIQIGQYLEEEKARQIQLNLQMCAASHIECVEQFEKCYSRLKEVELRNLCKILDKEQ